MLCKLVRVESMDLFYYIYIYFLMEEILVFFFLLNCPTVFAVHRCSVLNKVYQSVKLDGYFFFPCKMEWACIMRRS